MFRIFLTFATLIAFAGITHYAAKFCGFNERPVKPKPEDRRKRDAMLTPFVDSQD